MTRLFIEDYELDIQQDFSQQITYSVDDINNLDSKSTSFSKTIVLPATANNNRLLGNIFEFANSNFTSDTTPNVGYNFNASKSAKARLEVNGLQVMKGVIRLLEIIIDGKNIEYEVALFGELGGFISKLGAKKLTDNLNPEDDLDFSEHNHTYNYTNIIGSWQNTNAFSQYVQFLAPNVIKMIGNRGYLFSIGNLYTISNTSSNNGTFGCIDIVETGTFPSFYTYVYFDNNVTPEASVNANFETSKFGKGYTYPLIDYGNVSFNIPSSNPVYLSKKDYQYTAFRPAFFVKELMTKIINGAGYTYKSNFFNTKFFNRLIVPNNYKGLLRKNSIEYLSAEVTTDQTLSISAPISSGNLIVNFNVTISNPNFSYNSTTKKFKYTGASPITIKINQNFQTTTTTNFGDAGIILVGTNNVQPIVTLNTNQEFYFQLYATCNPRNGNASVTIYSGSTFNVISEPATNIPYQLGDTILMNDLLPNNILQKDFFTSIIKMFNLMITEDKFKEKHLIIEPNVSFYNTNRTSYLDWSDKVDRSQVIRLKPMSEVSSRYYILKYKDDVDFYNDKYKKQYNETYGTLTYDNALEFAKDTETTEVIFSPTTLVGYQNIDKVVSTILKLNNGIEESIESNIRILQVKLIEGVDTWKIINTNTITGLTSELGSLNSYLYAGHLDDPDVPSSDINFGATKELYFELVSGALSNNLFNTYYSSYIAEITDKDSRLLTCKMKFTEKDIYNLDFGRFIWLDGVLYRLIKIVDYADNNVCEVQLLRVIYTTYDTASYYEIGQSLNGGIIAYIDNSGQHGILIPKIFANVDDLVTYSKWELNYRNESTSTIYGSGLSNTDLIIAQEPYSGGSMAGAVKTQYGSEWFMPSIDELVMLMSNDSYFNYTIITTAFASSSTDGMYNFYLLDAYYNNILSIDKSEAGQYTIPIKYF